MDHQLLNFYIYFMFFRSLRLHWYFKFFFLFRKISYDATFGNRYAYNIPRKNASRIRNRRIVKMVDEMRKRLKKKQNHKC